ncbi:NUDIX hydrolase [Patescibacteria group bacterium]
MRKNIKLPKGAKKKYSGNIFDHYEWRQKMYDGSFEIFEIVARPDTVSIIAITPDKKILVQRQTQPHRKKSWISLPGGRVDDYEKPLAAAKRELLEETGYTSKKWQLYTKERITIKINWTIYYFIAKDVQKTHKPNLDSGEKITTYKYTFKQFLALADKKDYWDRELVLELLRAQADAKKMRQLKKRLFK